MKKHIDKIRNAYNIAVASNSITALACDIESAEWDKDTWALFTEFYIESKNSNLNPKKACHIPTQDIATTLIKMVEDLEGKPHPIDNPF